MINTDHSWYIYINIDWRHLDERLPAISSDRQRGPDSDTRHQIICGPGIAVCQTPDVLLLTADRPEKAEDLLEAYLQCEDDFPASSPCPSTLIVIDRRHGKLIMATDRIGRLPLYYRVSSQGFGAGTSPADLLSDSADEELSPQGFYHYMYFHMLPAPDTIYKEVSRLRGAERLTAQGDGFHVKRYWHPHFTQKAAHDRKTMYAKLREKLRRSVSDSMLAEGTTAAFLSGGLDSSTVAGFLAELSPETASAYAIGFDAEGYDEIPYARLSAEHFGIRLNEYYVTPEDVVDNLPQIAAAFDEPFGNSSALPAFLCARKARKDGVDRLLAGDGGDELFAGNSRYAQQKLFQPYLNIPAALRRGLIEPIINHLPKQVPLAEKARSYLRQAGTPLPERLHYYSFLEQRAPDTVFERRLSEVLVLRRPASLMRDTYESTAGYSQLDRLLHLDWQITLADNDLRKVSIACHLATIEVAYPMLSDQLLDFSLEVPARWKLPGRKLRDFYKEALRGWLPDATLSKSKHGFGLPFGVWMRDYAPLQELAYQSVTQLSSRGLFRQKFLEQAINDHRHGHAAYHGELIWLLCTLELWLQARHPTFSLNRD